MGGADAKPVAKLAETHNIEKVGGGGMKSK